MASWQVKGSHRIVDGLLSQKCLSVGSGSFAGTVLLRGRNGPLSYRKVAGRHAVGVECVVSVPRTSEGWACPAGLSRSTSVSQLQLDVVPADVAYELIEGPLVRFSTASKSGRHFPTAVLVHGILGSRKNLLSFAKRFVQALPSWQVVLVDLRCHGESAAVPTQGPHSVESSAADVLRLLQRLRIFPDALVGHSFGGKVVLSMAEQFSRISRTLPHPVQVWVLDALPAEVRSGGGTSGSDSPAELISLLRRLPMPIASRTALVDQLVHSGFSMSVAQWVATNVRPALFGGFEWSFNLAGIEQMYGSYEMSNLWSIIQRPSLGLKIDFVKAEFTSFLWDGVDEERIRAHGHGVHLLHGSGHWVHTDNPEGLLNILLPSLQRAE